MFQSQALQLQVEEAEHQTWREKQTSRMLIAAAQEEALDEIEEAHLEMREKAAKKQVEFEAAAKADAEAKCKMEVREERRVCSEKLKKMKTAADDKLEKECRGYEALMAHMQQKHDREKVRLTTRISNRDSVVSSSFMWSVPPPVLGWTLLQWRHWPFTGTEIPALSSLRRCRFFVAAKRIFSRITFGIC
jgi:hypothetical protein